MGERDGGGVMSAVPLQALAGEAPKRKQGPAIYAKTTREIVNAEKIKAAIGDEANDPALLLDMVEGETSLFECLAVLTEEILDDMALLAGLSETVKGLGERKSRIEKTIETKRNLMLMAMEKVGIPSVKLPLATLSVSNTQPQAEITDESLIPARFWEAQDPKLNKTDLASALRAGEQVPGATLGNGGVKLTLRVK